MRLTPKICFWCFGGVKNGGDDQKLLKEPLRGMWCNISRTMNKEGKWAKKEDNWASKHINNAIKGRLLVRTIGNMQHATCATILNIARTYPEICETMDKGIMDTLSQCNKLHESKDMKKLRPAMCCRLKSLGDKEPQSITVDNLAFGEKLKDYPLYVTYLDKVAVSIRTTASRSTRSSVSDQNIEAQNDSQSVDRIAILANCVSETNGPLLVN